MGAGNWTCDAAEPPFDVEAEVSDGDSAQALARRVEGRELHPFRVVDAERLQRLGRGRRTAAVDVELGETRGRGEQLTIRPGGSGTQVAVLRSRV